MQLQTAGCVLKEPDVRHSLQITNVIKENFSKNDLFKENERRDGKILVIYATGNINFVSF